MGIRRTGIEVVPRRGLRGRTTDKEKAAKDKAAKEKERKRKKAAEEKKRREKEAEGTIRRVLPSDVGRKARVFNI